MRRLGDVPGIEDLVPSSAVLPTDSSVLEVNGLGEVTASMAGIGDITDPYGIYSAENDPFALTPGFLDGALGGGEGEGGGVRNPMQSSFLPTYAPSDGTPAVVPGPQAAGSETHGTFGDASDPYGLTQRDGETIDNLTAAALDAAAKEFGAGFHIMQGSHSTDVAASGGTHAGGGVIDVAPTNGDWVGAMTALRKIGFAAWVRNVPGFGQAGSGAHIHAVLIGDEQLSPQAQTQVQSYLNNDDGLVGSRADDGPREYVNNRFVWGDARTQAGKDAWRGLVTKEAQTYLGTPFKWGGEDRGGLDDVGLIRNTYKKLGIDVPRTAFELAYGADPIPVDALKPGDLIAWDQHPESGAEHLGIYLGNGQYVEAGLPGRVVQLNELGDAALNAWGVPMQDFIHRRSPARPAPLTPPPVAANGAPLQGQSANPFTDTAPPEKHKKNHGSQSDDPPPNKFAQDMQPG